ncbi:MAG: outer membrane beta-barrel protein, partial [Deltaproteobacteria bacterium]|nr:outer membrane beta-barrel protein [Deltaproteobacteria bacterium]
MKKTWHISIAVVIVFLLSSPALAADKSTSDMPWEKGYLNLGAYFASLDTGFRLGIGNIGLGITLDAEDFLGLDSTDSAFRVDAGYRLGKSMRHKLDFSWFQFHRQAEKRLTEDVELPPELGGETLPTGMTVSSLFDFDIYKLKYEYSFILDDRVDFNAGLGVFIMPLEFGLGEKGKETKTASITAPLPVLGIGFDIALTPKWFLRQGIDFLYLEFSNFKGTIL